MINLAAPAPGTRLCALDDIADPGARGFVFREGEALFQGFVTRHGEVVRGWVDHCPHVGLPLSFAPDVYMSRDGRNIMCFNHGAVFRPEDGLCTGGPCAGLSLTPWPVRVRAGAVETA